MFNILLWINLGHKWKSLDQRKVKTVKLTFKLYKISFQPCCLDVVSSDNKEFDLNIALTLKYFNDSSWKFQAHPLKKAFQQQPTNG